MTVARVAPAVLACAVLLTAGCADRASPGTPRAPGDEPLVSSLPPELLGDVTPMPMELLTFRNRLHERHGDSPDLGIGSVEDGYRRVVVRWHGEPPADLLALLDEYAGAPFEIRLVGTRFRPGDLADEASRLVREHPGVVTGAGPRTEGDGVVVGIDPAAGRHDLAALGVSSRFPLFPEAMDRPVPAAG